MKFNIRCLVNNNVKEKAEAVSDGKKQIHQLRLMQYVFLFPFIENNVKQSFIENMDDVKSEKGCSTVFGSHYNMI